MIKAIRKDRYDLFETLLTISPKFLTYEVLTLTDE